MRTDCHIGSVAEILPHIQEMAFVLPNSRWSGAQADTFKPFETASIEIRQEISVL